MARTEDRLNQAESRSGAVSEMTDGDVTGSDAFRVLRMKALLTAAESSGSLELVEDLRDTGEGPARHVHRHSDEVFYVLAGGFRFFRADSTVDVSTGSVVLVPRGTPHRYEALSRASRVLIFYVPAGGFVDFLRELDGLLYTGMTSAEAMSALAGKYDSDPAQI